MNAYYQGNNRKTVVTDNTLFPVITAGDKLISFICMIVAYLTSATAVKIIKASICTAGFFAFFGLIGSMDSGNIGLLGGSLLCVAVTAVEFLIFKSMIVKRASK